MQILTLTFWNPPITPSWDRQFMTSLLEQTILHWNRAPSSNESKWRTPRKLISISVRNLHTPKRKIITLSILSSPTMFLHVVGSTYVGHRTMVEPTEATEWWSPHCWSPLHPRKGFTQNLSCIHAFTECVTNLYPKHQFEVKLVLRSSKMILWLYFRYFDLHISWLVMSSYKIV